jgi:hypothetical protein
MAARGNRLLKRILFAPTMQEPNAAPGFIIVEAVEVVAGRDTGLAAGTGIQIYSERILLAQTGRPGWQQLAIKFCWRWNRTPLVTPRKPFNRREPLLFGQQFVYERPCLIQGHTGHSSFEKMACNVFKSCR